MDVFFYIFVMIFVCSGKLYSCHVQFFKSIFVSYFVCACFVVMIYKLLRNR